MNEQSETDFEKIRVNIAQNLSKFRKAANLTQQDLAEKISYSDKAVSKWERGDGIPDVLVLKQLADIYGVTVNDFLVEHADEKPVVQSRLKSLWAKRWLIALISAGLVFFVATVISVLWLLIDRNATAEVAKFAYIGAIPLSAIVLLVFSCLWGKLWQRFVTVSALIWSLCLLVHVILQRAVQDLTTAWLIYIIGVAMQVLVILWFLLRFFVKRDKSKKEKV